MTDHEIMQQALKALELEDMACRYEKEPTPAHIANAIVALRERLAQPQRTHWEGCEEIHPECRKKNA